MRASIACGESPRIRSPNGDVAEDVAVRKERVVLEDEADPTPVRWDVREILSVEQNSTQIGSLKAGDDSQQGRLAASRSGRGR